MHAHRMVSSLLSPLLVVVITILFLGCSNGGGDNPGDSGAGGDSSGDVASRDGSSDGAATTAEELCDQFDDDGDGLVDEGCPCVSGKTQSCFPRAKGSVPAQEGELQGPCSMGTQTCPTNAREFEDPTWGPCEDYVLPAQEICGDDIDQDCSGSDLPCAVDAGPDTTDATTDSADAATEPVISDVEFSATGDCVIVACPTERPYVVGCDVTYRGGDGRACVAHHRDSRKVYFQEGNDCCFGSVSGTVTCSAVPGRALNETNCVIKTTAPGGFSGITYFQGGCGGCPTTKCNYDAFPCPYL